MPRLSQERKAELITGIQNGISINKLSILTGLGKSTIYYYYKKIKGKKYREPEFIPAASEIEGEIVGIFAGDGSQYYDRKRWHYEVNVHFGIKNRKYALHVKQLFESFFHIPFRLYRDGNAKLRLRIQSKRIFTYFAHYLKYDAAVKHETVRLRTANFPLAFKIGFLRGLFDTDGSISLTPNGKSIRVVYYTTSPHLARQVLGILDELKLKTGYHVTKRPERGFKDLHTIYLWKESVDTFLKTVKPYKARLIGRGR